VRIRIVGGRVVDPASGLDAVHDVYVADGLLARIGTAPPGFTAEREIDARGLVVCPGLVDLAARVREPGAEHKATIASETRAAVHGGVTTLCVPPDTDPVIDTPAVVELVHKRAADAGAARVEVLGALTRALAGERLAEMGALARAGCLGVSNGDAPIGDAEVVRRALEYAATFDLTVFLRPEDPWLACDGHVHEGEISAALGVPGIPESAETVSVARDLILAEQTGARIHFCRLSAARSVTMVAEARARGLPVSADVAAHQLHLSELDVASFDAMCHVRPPLRRVADRDGIRAGVADGSIDAVCSDHRPHERDAKLNPFPVTEHGVSGLETLLSLVLLLVEETGTPLAGALARVTCAPARILGLERGRLATGLPADVCIFDPSARRVLAGDDLCSRGRNTPFLGRELPGRVTHTLVGGRVVHEAGVAGAAAPARRVPAR